MLEMHLYTEDERYFFDAEEDDKVLYRCYFTWDGEIQELVEYEACPMLDRAVIQAAMNSLDLRGVKVAYSTNQVLYPVLHRLGFEEKDGRMEVSLEGYFTGSCACHKKN